ncbi:MAG: DNA-binding protein [Candidatus Omnitrophica bacterium CG07_land_8_20_14_0_80_42_15]|uniref:DNA-binding protein n=1 Tax=Candidatus Aquitaenariimonas noxiae TaxID=1974741 RepID=A0A2J0KWM2_9BACT|nr:MAG: DNA-binding protein [Candidatus Omnitrophica bacterium CG07_land_8_20_14_0_80_42_15]
MAKMIMDVNEVAKYLGFSSKKIYRLAETKQIPASRVGRQYRFLKNIIDDWLKDMSISSLNELKISQIQERTINDETEG